MNSMFFLVNMFSSINTIPNFDFSSISPSYNLSNCSVPVGVT